MLPGAVVVFESSARNSLSGPQSSSLVTICSSRSGSAVAPCRSVILARNSISGFSKGVRFSFSGRGFGFSSSTFKEKKGFGFGFSSSGGAGSFEDGGLLFSILLFDDDFKYFFSIGTLLPILIGTLLPLRSAISC